MVYESKIHLFPHSIMHERKGYGLLDITGDLGGVMEVFVWSIGILISPFSVFSFNMKAINKLFMAKTVDKNLFKNENKQIF